MANKQIPVAVVRAFVRATCELGHSWESELHKVRVDSGKRRPKTLQLSLDPQHCPNCGRSWAKYTETIHG